MLGDKGERAQNLRLRSAREQRGWSQKQVAAAVGTNAVMVSRWECGVMRPGPHFRQALCSLYKRTPEELGFLAPTAPAAPERSETWCVPLRRNGYFTGREALLERLHEALGTRRVPQAICGLAGIGKTQTALEYAHRWRDAHGAVLWADAASHESLTADFVGFAEALGLPASAEDESRVVVGNVLSWLGQSSGWLLVLDNVVDLATAEPFIPHGDGSVLLTMRGQASGTVAEGVELVAMPDADAVLFLLRRAKVVPPDGRLEDAPDFERDAAVEIASAFGGLPLALDQAGAYVEETGCGLAGYLARYRTQQDELLNRRGMQALDHPLSIAATLALTLSQVERADPAAADVLRLSAFLNPDGIPEEVFGGDTLPALADPLAFDSALEALHRYSLVRRDRASRTVSVHQLVQTVVRSAMDQDERAHWAARAVAAVERELPDLQTATWRGVQRYARQAHRCAHLIDDWEMESPEAARLLDQLGAYLRECARYTEAESLLRRALAMRESLLGADHPLTASTIGHLARVAIDVGQYGYAADLYRRALAVRERVLGPDHADTADALVGLANAQYQLGTYAEAEALWLRALAVQERTIGPDHAQTAYTLNTLAMLYRTLGRWDEAEPLLRRALAIRERALGPDHPRVGMVLNNLAVVLADRKRYGEAEACYRRALALYEQAHGPDHADVAITLHNLAGVHCDRGEAGAAEVLYRRSLAIRERTLGPDDPTIAFHLASLANVLQKGGRLDEAQDAATRALAIWRRTVGGGHASVARALSVLARVAAARQDVPAAAGLFRQALDISRQMLGPKHSGTMELEAEYRRLTGGGYPESFRGSVRTLAASR